MIEFKFVYRLDGGHVWVQVYSRKLPTETWACCGDVTFTAGEEFNAFRANFRAGKWVERK